MCIFTQVRVISISIPYPYPFLSLPTYLPSVPQPSYYQQKKASSIDHCFLLFPPVPLARARMYMYYMNLWKDSPPCPILFELRPVRPPPFPPRKKTFASAASPPPPLPCDGSSHIQSQLDKARQGKTRQATCLQKN